MQTVLAKPRNKTAKGKLGDAGYPDPDDPWLTKVDESYNRQAVTRGCVTLVSFLVFHDGDGNYTSTSPKYHIWAA